MTVALPKQVHTLLTIMGECHLGPLDLSVLSFCYFSITPRLEDESKYKNTMAKYNVKVIPMT